MVLVDTAVWIDFLRDLQTPATRQLRRLVAAEEAALAPVIMQEILQGARDERAFGKLVTRFTGFPMLGRGDPLVLAQAAARLYARARWQGVSPRSPHDCLIAAIAVAERAPLLADDVDFDRLREVEPKLELLAH